MFYYYPFTLPVLDLNKIYNFCDKKEKITRLYSDEGVYEIKNSKLFKIHCIDDESHGKQVNIGSSKFIIDSSKIKLIPSHKIPYNFEKREFTLYKKGRMTIEINNSKITHLYFMVESPDIYGVEEEIINLMKNICAKV